MMLKDLLTSAAVQEFIQNAIRQKKDELQVSSALTKKYSFEERAAIMDYMALVPKFREKFGTGGQKSKEFLLCDKLALEQSTAQDIGRYKAELWPCGPGAGTTVHDLCCGMGGDSFYLPSHLHITGVDMDTDRLAMYAYNCQALRGESNTLQADVRNIPESERADYFTIDPARRAADGENQRDYGNLTPTFAEVLEIAKRYRGGMAKLPPGYPTGEIPKDTEIVYIGGHSDCRECLVLFGELAKAPGTVRAVMVDKAGKQVAQWSAERDEAREVRDEAEQRLFEENFQREGRDRVYRTASSKSDLPLGEISKYISEPAAVLVRSRLFGTAAQAADPTAHLISEGIAYVASDTPLPAPGFTCFEVIDHTELSTGAVRSMLSAHGIGKLTLKLRGVKLDPDAEIRRLGAKGKESATLFYTRAYGEKVAILARLEVPKH
ncbi:MAG: hypothetical protein J6U20_11015 [Fibrobacter sp.]|nr:hypothetical protein [Fibrobacter sp.]